MQTTVKNLRSERYEVSFNRIHQQLQKMVKHHSTRFSKLVHEGAKRYSLVRTYQDELNHFAKLRNAMVHERTSLKEYIAEPNEKVVKRIEMIADLFMKPNYALVIATKPVVTYNNEDSMEEVIQGIKKHSYSQYPIYKDGKCVGLLTTRAIVKWLAENVVNSMVDLSEVKVMDILVHEEKHPLEFGSKSLNIFDVEEIFSKEHKMKHDLEAVLITENGLENEQPLGIITAWDLIEIDYTAD